MTPLLVHGMHGLGDNLHQRAVLRQLAARHEVWLETPWPSLYHDLPQLHLVDKGSRLRTQAKNAKREAGMFCAHPPPAGAAQVTVSYTPAEVRAARGILPAMCAHCGVATGDFRLPVPRSWRHGLSLPPREKRPLAVLRPLVDRREWGGCRARNPELSAWLALVAAIRHDFFVVSVADLEPGREWLAQPPPDADLVLHAGELDVRGLAALWRAADLVLTAPGFGVALAQAVGTPLAIVFGGYEPPYGYDAGARHSPTLAIAPAAGGCDCFSHHHQCAKVIDIPRAIDRLKEFASVATHYPPPPDREA